MAEPFPPLLDHLLRERRLTVRGFAAQVDVSWSFIQQVRKGTRPPPLERIEAWADALRLTGQARQGFMDAARWCHIPPALHGWLEPQLNPPRPDK